MWLGVDTGGTFTDFVLIDDDNNIRLHKCLSTPHAPEQAILQGVHALGLTASNLQVVHGSTVATNAVLEAKGVSTAFITNQGFSDTLKIGRQARSELYQLQLSASESALDTTHYFTVPYRLDAQAKEIQALSAEHIERLLEQLGQTSVQAVAINFLYSFLEPKAEQRLAQALESSYFVSCSHQVLAHRGEYERGMATWLNAYVGPLMQGYLQRLKQALHHVPLSIMQSSGGTISAEQAAQHAVRLLLSGPAGGLQAALAIGQASGYQRLMTFDMGGTSTDVALLDGQIRLSNEGRLANYPVAVPMVDMHTIGAGGGSIAWLDSGGLLQVGPQSAGASPGPACYGQGGIEPTVTDANVVLGRIPADTCLAGGVKLNLQAAQHAIEKLANRLGQNLQQTALGIIEIANEHMSNALRVISVQKGFDPTEFTLFSFGGAGGLHVCALADALGMKRAIIPANSGVLSALGMLLAPKSRELSQTMAKPLEIVATSEIETVLQQLQLIAETELLAEGVDKQAINYAYSVDLCYQGQSFWLTIEWQGEIAKLITQFALTHSQYYGHNLKLPLELVNINLSATAPGAVNRFSPTLKNNRIGEVQAVEILGQEQKAGLIEREYINPGDCLKGPLLIRETVATSFIAADWQIACTTSGELILTKRDE